MINANNVEKPFHSAGQLAPQKLHTKQNYHKMAKDISKVLFKIEDEAMWDHVMEVSDTKLVVVDIHQDWCGCCEAIHPSMSRVLLDYDECEQRFLYCTASIAKVGAKVQPTLPSDSHINLEKNGCLPLFGVYRVS
jgi:hypothetical protein